MCSNKDIDTLLEQIQLCHDHGEKRNFLKKLDVCGNCTDQSSVVQKENSLCRFEEFEHIEFLNLIEHARQSCTLKGAKGKNDARVHMLKEHVNRKIPTM